MKLHWRDLKRRPKPPLSKQLPINTTKPKPKACTTDNNPHLRSHIIPPEEFDHPYSRVHYEHKSIPRSAVQLSWSKSHPEFKDFLKELPPFHRAAAVGDVNVLDELCDKGVDINAPWEVTDSMYRHDRTGWDFTGAPPIHLAAYYDQREAVLFLLSNRADIDGRDGAGATALHAAAWAGNEEVFRTLLRKNADSSACDYDGWSVIIYATNQGQDKISQLLFEHVDDDTAFVMKKHYIRYTAKAGSEQIVLAMMKENEGDGEADAAHDSDILLTEALVGAAEGGHVELVHEILKFGADPAARDDCGSTALHWAAWGGHTEIENQRYNYDGDIGDDDCTFNRQTLTSPLHEEVIKTLIEKGGLALINARNSQGCAPLHWVAGAGSVGMIRFLLRNGADPEIRDTDGRSPLDRAKRTGDETMLQEFQRHTFSANI